MLLQDKIAFVTGSTRGIGWATAELFAEHGATLVLNGHSNAEALEKRVGELEQRYKIEATGILCDVADPEAVGRAYQQIFKTYRRLDVLVNNAGVLDDGLLGMIAPASARRTFDVNALSVLYCMQGAARLMARAKHGSIINLTSIIGRVGNAGQVAYGGSKAAVVGMTLSAAKELAPSQIRVNAIAPGFIETDMVRQLAPEIHEERVKSVKLGRIGTPRDVANAALFLASDLSSYITGQVLGVDGGMLI